MFEHFVLWPLHSTHSGPYVKNIYIYNFPLLSTTSLSYNNLSGLTRFMISPPLCQCLLVRFETPLPMDIWIYIYIFIILLLLLLYIFSYLYIFCNDMCIYNCINYKTNSSRTYKLTWLRYINYTCLFFN